MRSYKVLTLTDHSAHSIENSVYSLLSDLIHHEQVSEVFAATRGLAENCKFFIDPFNELYAVSLDDTFAFSEDGSAFKESQVIDPEGFDLIFLRLPRPVEDQFLKTLKERFAEKLIINDPIGILNTSDKSFLLNFPDVCPPIQLCRSIEEIVAFSKNFDCVLKPLKDYGGKGIVKISGELADDGTRIYPVEDYLNSNKSIIETEGMLAMKYLKNVSMGDKRTIVVGGKVMASSLRLPAEGKWMCNVAQGGRSESANPASEEFEIVERIKDSMKLEGIHIYGIDTLVNDDGQRVLSEINTLSVGGFPQAQKQTGSPIIRMTNDSIIKLANEYYSN